MKKVILLILSIIIISGLFYYYFNKKEEPKEIVFEEIKPIDTKYISEQLWPPVITISEVSEFVCNETPKESSLSQRVYRENINGQEYCISASSEGAAGSVYTEYSYSTIKFNKLITLDFTLRFNQCYNYEEDKIPECVNEREVFNPSNLVNEIISNVKLL